jgi:4'-phosphopantetheinyl transferase
MKLAPSSRLSFSRLTLEADVVDVWSGDLEPASEEIHDLRASLSPDELERASRFHFARDRQRFIASRGILRNILARYIGRSPETIRFFYGPFGKPSLAPEGTANGLCFNLSHAGGLALYAVALNRKVGVDLERIDPSFVGDGIEEKFFSRNEIDELRSLAAGDRPRAFFNCWTRKEAYVKALGGGLQIPLQSFDVSLAPDKAPAFLSERESGWSLRGFTLPPDYVAAIAAEGKNWRLRFSSPDLHPDRSTDISGATPEHQGQLHLRH